ncbi:MAG: AsmA family protein, partial [Gammaproteobacteria bacterium]|nr:AsmA family protein [Gammaproteobacteria bacterium]
PLLKKELEVDTIGLDGVMLNLARNKSGASNWDDLAQGKQHKSAPDKKQKQDTVDSSSGLKGVSIGGVDITDATINWDDRQSGQKYAISEFNLKSGAIVPGSPVGLNLGMVLQSAKPALKAKVGLVGTIELDQGRGLLNIGDLKFTVDADGAAIPNGKLQAELETALMLALDGTTLTLQNLKAKSGALSLTGNIKGSNLGTDSPVFNGQLKLAEFNLREWMASQGMALPATSDPKSLGRLAASLNLVSKGASTNLNKLVIQLDDTKVTGNAIMRGSATAFKLNVDAINLDRYISTEKGGQAQADKTRKSGAKQT